MSILKMILGIINLVLSIASIIASENEKEYPKSFKMFGVFFLIVAIVLIVNF